MRPILVEPAGRLAKAVGLDGVDGHLPVFFFELDQALGQAYGVLEEDVVVLHAGAHQERLREPFGEFDR